MNKTPAPQECWKPTIAGRDEGTIGKGRQSREGSEVTGSEAYQGKKKVIYISFNSSILKEEMRWRSTTEGCVESRASGPAKEYLPCINVTTHGAALLARLVPELCTAAR